MKIEIDENETAGFQIAAVLITVVVVVCILIHGCQSDPESMQKARDNFNPKPTPTTPEKPQ